MGLTISIYKFGHIDQGSCCYYWNDDMLIENFDRSTVDHSMSRLLN